ncbi:MAG: RNase adaptor protein RapZ [Acidocella sp. 20-57-95]|nr:MAG: RNase adaptor protein RapZ [Acidocella sp. 20-57-95]OYV58716.1 MAG: RNase adaptor protein RapZ [Acidocella sp. 21-58-7]HQT65140.1 RNase adapter RapZ [Acidocella sp.]HQU03578.1 RNase adapter RapZ [Acidocella sp.]
MNTTPCPIKVVLVTGLSGAGKNSILRALEDLGFETMDNPPLTALETLIMEGQRNIAIGVDARSRGFESAAVLETLKRLAQNPRLVPQLIYANATDEQLLRRYTETRHRHPLAQTGQVIEGVALERALTDPLRLAADLVIDTSTLPLHGLRRIIEDRFGAETPGMGITLVSFAYPAGLPREADIVLDARFLRNPHYEAALRPLSGQNQDVAAYIEADSFCAPYFAHIAGLTDFLLPRFVQEGKKYATIAIGCTGGQHRSVYLVERLAAHLKLASWRVRVTHREQPHWGEAEMSKQLAGTVPSR